jgi:hypothetical protein
VENKVIVVKAPETLITDLQYFAFIALFLEASLLYGVLVGGHGTAKVTTEPVFSAERAKERRTGTVRRVFELQLHVVHH